MGLGGFVSICDGTFFYPVFEQGRSDTVMFVPVCTVLEHCFGCDLGRRSGCGSGGACLEEVVRWWMGREWVIESMEWKGVCDWGVNS